MALLENPVQTETTMAADSFQRYYEEAGPDYATWSPAFNMHFGFFRRGMNPLRREAMLEQMNREVMDRLHLTSESKSQVLDMGCGLGATLRSFSRKLPHADLNGITLVPWQLEQGRQLNRANTAGRNIQLSLANYEHTNFPTGSFDAVYGIESSCYARGAEKSGFLREAHRLLRPGGRIVVADGFLRPGRLRGPQKLLFKLLCDCWVIDNLGEIEPFQRELDRIGFADIVIERIQARVTPSVLHVPWVTLKFLVKEVLFGNRRMSRARWNNILAPVLLPFVGFPVGAMAYYIVSATRA
jgi:ubiquinone/menaquinone biosynthesis C-methylase UbiE